MIEPLVGSSSYEIASKLLDAVTLRQAAIAANVANADTPGYKRVDLAPTFMQRLRASVASGNFATSGASLQPTLAVDESARSVRPDGNSVELAHELAEMATNTVEQQYLTDVVSTNLKQLRMAVTGQPS